MIKSSPLVSVIIPTYNRAKVVCEAVESVLAQTYSNIETIVVDDGSTDESQQKLARFRDRICVAVQDNAGPAHARNRGLSLARGEIVAFLDSDDYWLPEKLARQVELLETVGERVPCCVCNATVLRRDGGRTSTFAIADLVSAVREGLMLNPAEVLATRFVMFTQAAAVRRTALNRVGYFAEDLRFYEDYEWPLRLSLEGPWALIQDELVVYRDGSPGSWADLGQRESVRLHEDLVATRERILRQVNGGDQDQGLRKIMKRELKRSRRSLFVSRLYHEEFVGARTLSRGLRRIEWCRRALFHKSPAFPRAVVEAV